MALWLPSVEMGRDWGGTGLRGRHSAQASHYLREPEPQVMLQQCTATQSRGLKAGGVVGKGGERETFISKHSSDFTSSACTQRSKPLANAGIVHAISTSCLS